MAFPEHASSDDIAKNVDDVGKSADGVPQRAESGDEIGAAVEAGERRRRLCTLLID